LVVSLENAIEDERLKEQNPFASTTGGLLSNRVTSS
jgi:hypothetical protein